ncbi:unnamed protein product [Brassica napus]|uniref:(rape) hypothetical protein n=1 Tax=Brassica napus TaxID=3708 RepID=A0A816KT44_BRANA|nr:unnamed protein product [Brassica napus]
MDHLSRVISSHNHSYKDVCTNTTNHAEVIGFSMILMSAPMRRF